MFLCSSRVVNLVICNSALKKGEEELEFRFTKCHMHEIAQLLLLDLPVVLLLDVVLLEIAAPLVCCNTPELYVLKSATTTGNVAIISV
jgi:hypothetical protein